MFGIGTWELVLILILALLILGPDKLPEVARSVGKSLIKLRRTADEVKREIDLDGLGREIKAELLDDETAHELRSSLDLRSEMQQVVDAVKEPVQTLPAPDEHDEYAAFLPSEEEKPLASFEECNKKANGEEHNQVERQTSK
jgi:sec-independent protein translocase protein TatB